jgi:hypothetical protein
MAWTRTQKFINRDRLIQDYFVVLEGWSLNVWEVGPVGMIDVVNGCYWPLAAVGLDRASTAAIEALRTKCGFRRWSMAVPTRPSTRWPADCAFAAPPS